MDAACGYRLLVNRAKVLKRGRGGIIELEKGKDKNGASYFSISTTRKGKRKGQLLLDTTLLLTKSQKSSRWLHINNSFRSSVNLDSPTLESSGSVPLQQSMDRYVLEARAF